MVEPLELTKTRLPPPVKPWFWKRPEYWHLPWKSWPRPDLQKPRKNFSALKDQWLAFPESQEDEPKSLPVKGFLDGKGFDEE